MRLRQLPESRAELGWLSDAQPEVQPALFRNNKFLYQVPYPVPYQVLFQVESRVLYLVLYRFLYRVLYQIPYHVPYQVLTMICMIKKLHSPLQECFEVRGEY